MIWVPRLALSATIALLASTAAMAQTRPPRLGGYNHIVVIYQENHSFDNLYGKWGEVPGAGHAPDGLPAAPVAQIASDGVAYRCLLQLDVNLTAPSPLAAACSDYLRNGTNGTFDSAFPATSFFSIDAVIPSTATTCPPINTAASNGVLNGQGLPGGCTRDIVHRYYQEQFQLNGGKLNRYVLGSDAAGLVLGVYDSTKLPIYRYLHNQMPGVPTAPNYVIADKFFQAAYGGSFLNHQWLIAAATPVFANADNSGGSNDLHSVVDGRGMPVTYPLYSASIGTAVADRSLTASCSPASNRAPTPATTIEGRPITCGDYVVNTIQPFAQPYAPGTADARRLPPLTNPTIGDRLSDAGVSWAWFSGGWDNAAGNVNGLGWTNGAGPTCSDPATAGGATYPFCPRGDFQFHHQPFNYFANYAPDTAARAAHLKDVVEFLQLARSGALPAVSFVKPIGSDNEHPGYASEPNGSDFLVELIRAVVEGPNADDTLIIVTYDEFGGQADHVAPPSSTHRFGPSDAFGPGTRIPALLLARNFPRNGIDSQPHDTTSIVKTIELRFKLAPLSSRDARVEGLNTALNALGN